MSETLTCFLLPLFPQGVALTLLFFGPSRDLYEIFALETLMKCSLALTDLYLPTDSTAIFLLYFEWSDVIFVCYICMC